jgi:hypothetical protein
MPTGRTTTSRGSRCLICDMPEDKNGCLPQGEDDDYDDPDEWRDHADE